MSEKTVKIIENEKDNYRKYFGQCQCQDAYIELDCKSGVLSASYDAEIGNAVPFSVYHGHDQRWGISPYMKIKAINKLLEKIEPWAQQIIDGYEEYWDGNNNVARFDKSAKEADETIQAIIEEHDLCDDNVFYVLDDWSEWFVDGWKYLDFEDSATEFDDMMLCEAKDQDYRLPDGQKPSEWLLEAINESIDEEEEIKKLPVWVKVSLRG